MREAVKCCWAPAATPVMNMGNMNMVGIGSVGNSLVICLAGLAATSESSFFVEATGPFLPALPEPPSVAMGPLEASFLRIRARIRSCSANSRRYFVARQQVY